MKIGKSGKVRVKINKFVEKEEENKRFGIQFCEKRKSERLKNKEKGGLLLFFECKVKSEAS